MWRQLKTHLLLPFRLNNIQFTRFGVVTRLHRNLDKQNIILAKKPFKPLHIARELSVESEVFTSNGHNEQEVQTSDEKERLLKIYKLEVDIAYQEGRRVPAVDFFKEHHWDHILSLPSKSARFRYYGFLWQIEVKKKSKRRKQEEKAAFAQTRIDKVRQERAENSHIVYGLGHVSMFHRVYDSTINHWMNHRLIRAMQFSPKIVLDCSYDEFMNKREAENAAKQLMLCFADNRAHDDPFDLHYCNTKLDSTCMMSLQRYIPTMLKPEFPMNVHQRCFTDIFPKENLIYLTPHCHTDLKEYNPDKIYVIGAMVDTVNNDPLSLAKAKKLGLQMARLPLDKYLQWGSGSGKSLTLNQMINIMLDLKTTGDWMTALSHVPRRKVVNVNEEYFRDKMNKRANRINVRIDRLFDNDNARQNINVRSNKQNLQFKMSTWGSKIKKTS